MKAIILAAGVGKRLRPITDKMPKCLIEINGEALIERYIRLLRDNKIKDVVIVVGHLKDLIISRLKAQHEGIKFIYNSRYQEGNVTSLFEAKEELNGECLLMDADVYFEKKLLEKLIMSENDNCFLADTSVKQSGEEMMLGIVGSRVVDITRDLGDEVDLSGEGVGFVKLSKKSSLRLKEIVTGFVESGKVTSEYEECLQELVQADIFGYESVSGLKWTEIDFQQDVEKAARLGI